MSPQGQSAQPLAMLTGFPPRSFLRERKPYGRLQVTRFAPLHTWLKKHGVGVSSLIIFSGPHVRIRNFLKEVKGALEPKLRGRDAGQAEIADVHTNRASVCCSC